MERYIYIYICCHATVLTSIRQRASSAFLYSSDQIRIARIIEFWKEIRFFVQFGSMRFLIDTGKVLGPATTNLLYNRVIKSETHFQRFNFHMYNFYIYQNESKNFLVTIRKQSRDEWIFVTNNSKRHSQTKRHLSIERIRSLPLGFCNSKIVFHYAR